MLNLLFDILETELIFVTFSLFSICIGKGKFVNDAGPMKNHSKVGNRPGRPAYRTPAYIIMMHASYRKVLALRDRVYPPDLVWPYRPESRSVGMNILYK